MVGDIDFFVPTWNENQDNRDRNTEDTKVNVQPAHPPFIGLLLVFDFTYTMYIDV